MTYTKLINNHVLFSFDNPYDIHSAAKLYRYLDTRRALGDFKYAPKIATGSYKGHLEPAVMMDYNDFMEALVGTIWIENQESFMVVNPVNPRQPHRQQGTLLYRCGNSALIGEFKEVSKVEALQCDAWTYIDEKYFVCGVENEPTTKYGLSEFAQANYGRGYSEY